MKIPAFLIIIEITSVFANSNNNINSTASERNLDLTTQPIPTINRTDSKTENIQSAVSLKIDEISSGTRQTTTITTPTKINSNITKSNAVNSSSTTTTISTTDPTTTISSSSTSRDDIAPTNSTTTTLVDSNTPPSTTTTSSPTSSDDIAPTNSTITTLVDSNTPVSTTPSSSNTTFFTRSSTTSIPTTTPFNPQDWRNTKILTKKGLDLQNHADKSIQIASPADGDFQTFIRDSSLWVDKSLLIREIWENLWTWDMVITAPPKWGKTINLSMFKFYCDLSLDSNGFETPRNQSASHLYFNEGKIVSKDGTIEDLDEPPLLSGYNEHLANHSVIYISGSNLSIENGLESFRTMIHETYRRHESLLNRLNIEYSQQGEPISRNIIKFRAFYDLQNVRQLNDTYLTRGIQILSRLLFEVYQRKVIVLFDDYDKYMHKAYFEQTPSSNHTYNEQQFAKMWDIFLRNTFQQNRHLEKAILSGVLKVRDPGSLPGYLNYYNAYVFDDEDLFPYYGFFEIEFDQLATKRGIDKSLMDNATQWYGGYRTLSNSSHQMFSPYSVIQFVNTLQIQDYWSTSSFTEFMKRLLGKPKFRQRILVMGKSYREGKNPVLPILYRKFKRLESQQYADIREIDLDKIFYHSLHEDTVFSILVSSGYFAVLQYSISHVYVLIKIPNQEIFMAIKSLLRA